MPNQQLVDKEVMYVVVLVCPTCEPQVIASVLGCVYVTPT